MYLGFTLCSNLFFPAHTCLPELTLGYYILALLQTQMDLLDSILRVKARMTQICLFTCKMGYFFLDGELGLNSKTVCICQVS